MTFPDPDKLDDYLLDPTHEAELSRVQARRDSVKAEGVIASKYWGGIQWRIVVTFSVYAVLWTSVLVLGLNGMIPLWAGLIVNTMLAATFYMPMHEAVHKNIWGKVSSGRVVEEIIGTLCSVPLLMPFRNHRASHMRHHAYTNDQVPLSYLHQCIVATLCIHSADAQTASSSNGARKSGKCQQDRRLNAAALLAHHARCAVDCSSHWLRMASLPVVVSPRTTAVVLAGICVCVVSTSSRQ
jgi:hypothetical protein